MAKKLRWGPERLQTTLDSLREGMQILSPDFRYLYVNAAVAAHGRKAREELLGRTMTECYPGIEQTEMYAVLERCMRERTPASLENEFTYESGEKAWFELRIHPCPEGLFVLSVDVTERKELEAKLRQAHKLRALGQMAAGVAHDLKNILNPIGLWVSVLERRLAKGEEVGSTLTEIRAALKRGSETVDVLRNFARQAPERVVAQPVEIDTVAREAIELCLPRATEQPVKISMREQLAGAPSVRVDASELLSALVNLVSNAIDALPNGGSVTLASGSSEEGAWVEVADTGVGMPPEVIKRAFEPFFSTKGEAGTGLGLAMVYAFALRNRGQVKLASEPGRGTSIRLVFPPA